MTCTDIILTLTLLIDRVAPHSLRPPDALPLAFEGLYIFIFYLYYLLEIPKQRLGLDECECSVPSYSYGWQKHNPKNDHGPYVDRGRAQIQSTSNYILSSELTACQSQPDWKIDVASYWWSGIWSLSKSVCTLLILLTTAAAANWESFSFSKQRKMCRYIFARHNVLKKVFTGLQICERSNIRPLGGVKQLLGPQWPELEGIHSLELMTAVCFNNVF